MGTRDYRERNRFCEVCIASRPAAQVHHIRSKGAGGSNKDSNLLSVCAECHSRIHSLGWKTFVRLNPVIRAKVEAAHEAPR